MGVEHPDHRLPHREDLSGREELQEQGPGGAEGRGATRDGDGEPPGGGRALAAQPRPEPEVLDGGADVVLPTALEGDLELARQGLPERVPEEVAGEGLGVGRDVEELVLRHPSVRASHHVPHRVAPRARGRQSGLGELAHRRLEVGRFHEVELDVLAGGDVEAATREAPGHLGKGAELAR